MLKIYTWTVTKVGEKVGGADRLSPLTTSAVPTLRISRTVGTTIQQLQDEKPDKFQLHINGHLPRMQEYEQHRNQMASVLTLHIPALLMNQQDKHYYSLFR